ncbi:centromere protein F-like [Gopherus flavomarginatus]|uniref:centromere protein F-like n=1 Tax=Gopherus flavomarginatus TaxID=286002 RepID=UPI0021CC0742|nr:centromere protein F-like [Gopherus flavomarginatus]
MLERKVDALLSDHRQFVEKNRLSLEQKIKEKEKEVFRQLHDLLTEDLQCEQINQDLQQANNTLQAELDKEMKEKSLLSFQSAQKSEKIHLLEEELKTVRHFLKETQNYAEEMKRNEGKKPSFLPVCSKVRKNPSSGRRTENSQTLSEGDAELCGRDEKVQAVRPQ